MSTVLIKFRDKGKHLGVLFNKMESRKLGKLKVFPAVGDCGKKQTEWNGTLGLQCVLVVSFYCGVVKTSFRKVDFNPPVMYSALSFSIFIKHR